LHLVEYRPSAETRRLKINIKRRGKSFGLIFDEEKKKQTKEKNVFFSFLF